MLKMACDVVFCIISIDLFCLDVYTLKCIANFQTLLKPVRSVRSLKPRVILLASFKKSKDRCVLVLSYLFIMFIVEYSCLLFL